MKDTGYTGLLTSQSPATPIVLNTVAWLKRRAPNKDALGQTITTCLMGHTNVLQFIMHVYLYQLG